MKIGVYLALVEHCELCQKVSGVLIGAGQLVHIQFSQLQQLLQGIEKFLRDADLSRHPQCPPTLGVTQSPNAHAPALLL